ncbi:MAG: NYN domain-containing protein [Planctomycetales bacterium]|nr:NYN domain-containing protein [Planctomycetales bacterium]
MPSRFLIIDGYNLLYAAGMGRASYGPGDLERCRRRLQNFLADKLTAAELSRASVIFDARLPPTDAPRLQMHGPLRILFASPHGDADLFIEELLAAHSSPKQVTLVSSDHRLQKVARNRRAKHIDSEVFFDDLDHRRPRGKPDAAHVSQEAAQKTADGLSETEVAYWLAMFGEVAIAKSPRAVLSESAPEATTPHGTAKVAKRPRSKSGSPVQSKPNTRTHHPRGKPKDVAPGALEAWRHELEQWLRNPDDHS